MSSRSLDGFCFGRVALAAGLALAAGAAQAATRTWSGAGGDNNWRTTANWDAAATTNDVLTFSGSTRLSNNNNFTAPTVFNGLTMNSGAGAFVLGGNALRLAGDIVNNSATLQTVNVAITNTVRQTVNCASGHITLGGVLSGSGAGVGLTKTGAYTLTLSAANIYAGATTNSAGTLKLNNAAALPANTQLALQGTAVLDLNGFNATVANISASTVGNVITNTVGGAVATNTLTLGNQSSTTAALIRDGAVRVTAVDLVNGNSGTTPFTLSTSNTFSGGLTLKNQGTGTRLTVNAAPANVGSAGAIVSSPFGTGPIIIGQAPTDKAGIYFSTVNNTVVVNNIVYNTALGTDRVGIRADTTGHTLSGTLFANQAPVTFCSNGTGSFILTGQVTGPNGFILDNSSGSSITVTLNNAGAAPNNYQGSTIIAGTKGVLILGRADQVPNGAGAGHVIASGTLRLASYNETINGLAGSGIVEATGGFPTLTLGDNDASGLTFTGTVRNTGGVLALTKIGTGTQALAGNNTYGGNTTISGGKLVGVGGGSCSNSTVVVQSGAGTALGVRVTDSTKRWSCGHLTFNAGTTVLNVDFGIHAAAVAPSTSVAPLHVLGDVLLTGTPTVIVDAGNLPPGTYPLMTWGGTLTGTAPTAVTLPSHVAGSLSVDGKSLVLTVTSNTQPLAWTAGDGDWDVGLTSNWKDSSSAAATYLETTLPGDTVFFDDNASGAGPFAVNLTTTLTPMSVTFTNDAKAYTLTGAGALAGPMPLVKQGSGTLTLDAANTFAGGVTLAAGTLNLNQPAALGSANSILTITGGTLDCTAASPVALAGNPSLWNGDFTFSGSQALDLGAGSVTLSANRTVTVGAGTLAVAGAVAGAGRSLTKAGAGELALNGANTYSGGTALNAGTLSVGAANGLGTGAVTMQAGTTLNLSATTTGDITYSGLSTSLAGAGTVNITLTNQPAASSTRTLSGNYAGFAGTFNVGVGAGPGFGKIQINGADSAALTLNVLPNASVFVASGTHLAAINLFGGDTGETYGQLRLDGGAWAGPITLAGDITTNNDSIVGSYGSTGTLSGNIGETGGPRTLTKGGAGTIILSGVNTYSGGTVLRGGVLQVNATESMGGGDILFAGGVRLSLGNGVTVTNAVYTGPNAGVASRGLLECSSGGATLTGPVIITNAAVAGGHFASVAPATLYVNGPVYASVAPFFCRAGTVVFSGGGAYRSIDLSQDTLRLGADNGLCTTSLFNIASAATANFDLAGYDQTLDQVTKGGYAATIGSSSTNRDALLTITGSSTYAGTLADTLGAGTRKVALTVNGGTLTLSGANTHSGTTTVREFGTLSVNGNGALGAVPADATPGRLALSNGALRATANMTLSAARGTALAAGTSNTLENTAAGTLAVYNGVIAGAGALAVSGAGGWELGGDSTYTGGTTLGGGLVALRSSSAGAAGSPDSGPLGAGATSVRLAGSQLRASTAFGVPSVSVGNALALEADTTFPSGAAGAYSDKPLSFTGPVTLAKSITLTVGVSPATASVTFAGALGDGGSGYGVTKSGGGTLVLAGVNTYSGPTAVSTGKLVVVTGGSCASSAVTVSGGATLGVRVASAGGQWSCAGLTNASGAASTLEFAYGSTSPSTNTAPLAVTGSVAFDGTPTVTVSADRLETGASYPLLTWTGTRIGTAPSAVTLPPRVAGTLRVDGNTLYLDVTAGFSQPLRWATVSGAWDLDTTANWVDSASTPQAATYVNGNAVQLEDTQSGAGPLTVTLDATVTPASVTVNNPTKDYTVSGAGKLSGAAGLAKSGAGTLTLATANDYSGATDVAEGTVKLGAAAGLGATAGETTVHGGATLDLNGQTVGAEPVNIDGGTLANDSGAASLSGPVAAVSAGSLGGAGSVLTLSGVLSGSAPLSKVGTNTVVLSAANSYEGEMTVGEGTVRAANGAALGSAAVATVIAGGTLDVNGQNLGAKPVTASGAGVGAAGAVVNYGTQQTQALRFMSLDGDTTFGGTGRWDIRANPTATFDMGGFTVVKTNANSFHLVGVTVLNPGHFDTRQGTLSIETGTKLAGGAANTVTVRPGTMLQFYDLSTPAAWSLLLSETATVHANHQAAATDNVWAGPVTMNGPATFNCAAVQGVSGVISGTGPLIKTGASTLTLTAENTYGGGTVVTNGTLQLGNGTTANGGVAGAVDNQFYLTFSNPYDQVHTGLISGTGIVAKAAGGVLTLTAANTFTGPLQLKGGVLNVASLADYGVPCALGARAQLQENGTAGAGVGLHFQSGTLQYTGAAPQRTDRMMRLQGSTAGVTNTIDASGLPGGTLSFSYSGKNTNFWDTPGKRTLRLTGTNTGDNVFALNIQDHTGATTLIKGGTGKWLVTNTHNSDALTQAQSTYGGFTGGALLEGGWLGFATNALGSSGLITVSANAVLEWYGVNGQDLSARLRLEDGATATLNTGSNDVTFATALQLGAAKSAGLAKSGSGTLTLASTNLFTGLTTVSAGTLRLGATNALVSGATVALAGGALDVNGKRQTLAGLAGSGTLKMDPSTGAPSDSRLTVTGELDLTGVTLSLANLGALDRNQSYLLATAGTLTGTFAAVQPLSTVSGWRPYYNEPAAGALTLRYSRSTLILLR